jgi:predicted phosphodiesterase
MFCIPRAAFPLSPERGPAIAARAAVPVDRRCAWSAHRAIAGVTLLLCATAASASQLHSSPAISLPRKEGSVRFAVIGDSGRGSREQQAIADQMAAARISFPFEFVIMLGDNLYEFQGPADYIAKFEKPYAALLQAGVNFFAAVGNHDPANEEHYARFNMDGRRYYTYKKGNVRFFVLDSTALGPRQLSWLDDQLTHSRSDWKIVYLHHPLYTSGRYGRTATLVRAALEPLFVEKGVDVVFSGHEHFYERLKPQNGITYFISGGAGSLRKGDIRPDPQMAAGFDRGFHFMLVEIAGDDLYFQAIDQAGRTVDSGVVTRQDRDRQTGAARPYAGKLQPSSARLRTRPRQTASSAAATRAATASGSRGAALLR